jgi:two-component system response regulator AgrA
MKLVYHTTFTDYEIYSSFSQIQDKLPENFVRCHKSYIVNLKNISGIKLSSNEITFKNKSVCYIGPKYKEHFMEVFNHATIFE